MAPPPVDRSMPPGPGDDELAAWLWLLHAPGLGRSGARRVMAALGPPAAVLAAAPQDWQALGGPALADALRAPPAGHAERLAAVLAWRRGAAGRRVMVLGEADYPAALLQTADPPLLLYLQGDAALLNAPSLAIVGSRQPSAQGREHARRFARALAGRGWTIVSGLAAGIDGAAHEGALAGLDEGGGSAGSTIAVVGTGLDRVYPPGHRALAQRIAVQGLLVSEMDLGTPPLAANFPQRNRIIAGLARGTLVVEAALRSGSLITARLAAEAGREVMALPGSLLSPQSAGCHALIRQGAALVTSVDEVLQELGATAAPPPMAAAETAGDAPGDDAAPAAADPVLDALGHDPQTLDALIARCGWPAPALSARLLALEIEGLVARLPGGLYQRVGRG